jgi:hypothetical protein
MNHWYLGIDIGNTGISALLLNGKTGEIYPIYWIDHTNENPAEVSFRLPLVSFTRSLPGSDVDPMSASIFAGYLADKLAEMYSGLFVEKFKPYLQAAIPYFYQKMNNWQPMLKWHKQQPLSLYFFSRTLQELLATFKHIDYGETGVNIAAKGLDYELFKDIINNLAGVILGYPVGWGDTYQFNLREAVLAAKLVKKPQQIFFISDALATILSRLDQIQNGEDIDPAFFTGGLLVINAGDHTTEMGLVELPDNWRKLTPKDFVTHNFKYAGNSLDQDIICQMLLRDEKGKIKTELLAPLGFNLDPINDLPQPGEPELEKRDRLQQLLYSSDLGQTLLQAANYLKLILEYRIEIPLEVEGFEWKCSRSQLQQKVILPYIKRLNRELNILLSYTPIGTQGINQVLMTGGTSALKEMKEWLEQKFPNAVIIQDDYRDGGLKTCSRVAHGLSVLPLYPQAISAAEYQYTDYFLIWELLQIFVDKPLTFTEIMQLLQKRGINIRVCKDKILNILDAKIPIGLIPTINYGHWLHTSAWQNLDYQAIAAEPLFTKNGANIYDINSQQKQKILAYLSTIFANSHQKLSEPLILDLTAVFA